VLALARPSLLPPGGGPDLTHHLQLVDYIERHWQLPDAPAQAGELRYSIANISAARRVLGYQPSHTIERDVDRVIDDIRAHSERSV
jgi:nucleoside-diphosphate-sugar epimerase